MFPCLLFFLFSMKMRNCRYLGPSVVTPDPSVMIRQTTRVVDAGAIVTFIPGLIDGHNKAVRSRKKDIP